MGHAADADEFLEILGDELRAVVGDNARPGVGIGFAGALDDGFHVVFLHLFSDLPVDNEAAAAIEDAAEEVKGPGDVEVTDIDVPVLMRQQGLHKAGPLLGGRGGVPGQESRGPEDAIDAGRAACDDISIEHHEREPAITFQRVLTGEAADPLLLGVGQPMVARHPGVVLVDLAESRLPVVELAGADTDPGQEAADGDLGLIGPGPHKVHDLVARIMGDPASRQGSPSSFFSWVYSSMSSDRTSFFRCSLASSCSILRCLASSAALDFRLLSKAAWPFSKNSFCQR